MMPFSVTCYRNDVGIFTVYGARIKQSKTTYPNPPKAIHNLPARRDPRFIDKVFYDVVLFTNSELTQSFASYRSKDLYKAQNYLYNFIYLCKRGYKYIDLEKVPDTPIPRPCPIPPGCGPFPPFPYNQYQPWFYKNDKFDCHIPDSEIDPRYIGDPRKNPWYDVFDTITREPRYAGEPFRVPDPNYPYIDADIEVDYDNLPKNDGEVVRFEPKKAACPPPCPIPDCPPFPIPDKHHHYRPEPPCPPYDPPYQPPRPPYYPPCPPKPHPPRPPYYPPCPPPFKEKIVVYYGNGGFAMGESVQTNIKELAPNALRTMISKNFHSTFSNMNPRDRIVVKKNVLDCILESMVFKTNMDVAGEWSFFMIPDKFYKLVENFNWYYKEETYDGVWYELDKSIPQTTFVMQDNGIRYFVNAVRLNGRYSMRFAKSGRDFNTEPEPIEPDADNRDLDVDMKFVVSVNIQNCAANEYSVTVEDLSVTNQVVRVLSDFIHDELAWQAIENHVYELKVYAKEDTEKQTPIMHRFFVAIPDANYNHGFCTWVSDTYDSSISLVENGFVRVIDLVAPKTASANDRLVLTDSDIIT